MRNSENEFREILRGIDHAREQLRIVESGPEFLNDELLGSIRESATRFAQLLPELMRIRRHASTVGDPVLTEQTTAIINQLTTLCDRVAAIHDQVILGAEILE